MHSERLFDDYDDEISRRCSISRGYYAAFHYVREKWDNNNNSDFRFGSGDHGKAEDFFREIGHRNLASDLHALYDRRKRADYDIDLPVDEMYTSTFQLMLEEFLSEIEQIPEDI